MNTRIPRTQENAVDMHSKLTHVAAPTAGSAEEGLTHENAAGDSEVIGGATDTHLSKSGSIRL